MVEDLPVAVDGQGELSPATSTVFAMLCRSSPALARDREARAVEDEVEWAAGRHPEEFDPERACSSRECDVVRAFEVESHEQEDRARETLGLAQGERKYRAQRDRGLNGKVGVAGLSTLATGWLSVPLIQGGGETQKAIALPRCQTSLVLSLVPRAVFRLKRRVGARTLGQGVVSAGMTELSTVVEGGVWGPCTNAIARVLQVRFPPSGDMPLFTSVCRGSIVGLTSAEALSSRDALF